MHMEPIKTVTRPAHFEKGAFVEGQTLKIYIDPDPVNPRTEFDNFGHMVCFHRRYDLGDPDHGISSKDFDSWDELEEYLIQEKGAVLILPLYLYDHSGITIRTYSFNDHWDSGMVGFIYATNDDILKNWMVKEVTQDLKDQALRLMQGEVKEYDDYLTGNVYGYELEDENGEFVDSCWGFFGDNAEDYIRSDVHMQEKDTQTQVAA